MAPGSTSGFAHSPARGVPAVPGGGGASTGIGVVVVGAAALGGAIAGGAGIAPTPF